MPRFERAGQTSVLNMLGGWEASRATNQSAGDDPVSMGLVPYISPGPAPPMNPVADTVGAVFVPEQVDEDTRQMQAWNPDPDMPTRFVNLDSGQALLDGAVIPLSLDDIQRIMETIIDAYDRSMRERVISLRMEYLHQTDTPREEVRPTDTEAALVRQVPRETETAQPEESGPPPASHVQPLPAPRRKRRRRVQHVPSSEVREAPPTPEA